jgi:oligopeptide transport system substrate-binding protein
MLATLHSKLNICLSFRSAGSSPAIRILVSRRLLALSGALVLLSCSGGTRETVANVSVIGDRPSLSDPNRTPPDAASSMLLAATAQGLVRLDGDGEIDPGLAERWIVTDDGLSHIFRIRRSQWTNGREVDALDVASALNHMLRSNNRLVPYLGGIEKISGMTGRVVEIRLSSPQPRLLQLLAQPDAAMMQRGAGTGPLRLVAKKDGVYRLRLRQSQGAEGEEDRVTLRGDSAARAVSRYRQDMVHWVANGRFVDLAIARASRPNPAELRFDNADGLFGLAIAAREGFLGSAANRSALSMSVDRERLLRLYRVDGWRQAVSITPSQFDLPKAPAAQGWVALGFDQRLTRAAGLIATWRASHGKPPTLRVWLPEGPGPRLMFAALAADWARIGLKIVASDAASADLRLIDEVAPETGTLWYLTRVSCAQGFACSTEGEKALKEAGATMDGKERAELLSKADAAFASAVPFIPIASPLRWSLVSPELLGWKENMFAAHPLAYIRAVKR